MAKNEAVDAVSEQSLALGIHCVATAVMCSAAAFKDELELARRILQRCPKRLAPREAEDPVATWNRHMDAAILSCNDSENEPTRAARRARLAADLDRAGLVLIDRAMLASLVDAEIQLDSRDEIVVTVGAAVTSPAPGIQISPSCSISIGVIAAEQAAAGGIDHHELLDEGAPWSADVDEAEGEDLGAELLDGEEPFATVATDAIDNLIDRLELANGSSITFVDDGTGESFAGIEGGYPVLHGDYSDPRVND